MAINYIFTIHSRAKTEFSQRGFLQRKARPAISPVSMIVYYRVYFEDDFCTFSLIEIIFRGLCSLNRGKCSLYAFSHRPYVCFMASCAALSI